MEKKHLFIKAKINITKLKYFKEVWVNLLIRYMDSRWYNKSSSNLELKL